jgi:hypothetical protein
VLIEPILRDSATEIARYTYPKKFGTRLSGGAPPASFLGSAGRARGMRRRLKE